MSNTNNENKKIRILQCTRCGWEWATRNHDDPKNCPNCKSPYWNKKKVRFLDKNGKSKSDNII